MQFCGTELIKEYVEKGHPYDFTLVLIEKKGDSFSAYKKSRKWGILGKSKGVEGFIDTFGEIKTFNDITKEFDESTVKNCIIGLINNCIKSGDVCLLCTGNEWDKHKDTDGSNFPGVYNLR